MVGPGPVGPYTFTDSCHLTTNTGQDVPVTLAADDATFKLSSGQTHTTIVPVGAKCTITETATPAGDTVTYNGASSPPTLTITSHTTLAVTNTFHPPPTHPSTTTTTAAPAALTATGTSPATPTPATSASAATEPSPSTPLAFTGANLASLLADGVALVTLGVVLVLIGRRRRRRRAA